MKKRMLALCLAAVLLLGTLPVFGAQTFSDVPEGSWYAEAVNAMHRDGLVQGVGESRFAPAQPMTRAMAVAILCRMSGGVLPRSAQTDFTDVPADAWYAKSVAWAQQNRIAFGTGEHSFSPNARITREELAALLLRYAGMRYEEDIEAQYGVELAFSDDDPVSGWAQRAMRAMIGAKVLQGRKTADGTRYAARETCTRAEAAAMLYRFLQLGLTDRLPQTVPDLSGAALNAMADAELQLARATHQDGNNTVLSPLSMLYALDLLAEGASGETLSQLEAFFALPTETLTAVLGVLQENLSDGISTVRCANSVWVNDGLSLQPGYAERIRPLQAAVMQRTFGSETAQEMNRWVSEQTDGLIPAVIDRLSPEEMLVLMNALLFKANWSEPYDPIAVTDRFTFHTTDGRTQTTSALRSEEHTYLSGKDVIGFRKPFSGGRYSFAVLVPQGDSTPEALLASLDGAALRRLLQGERYDMIHATMPKFKADTQADLKSVLADVGITNLNELDRLVSGSALSVSRALHKAVIDVNESGVSAAAVTAILTAGVSIPQKEATVIADRPYVYMIVDNETLLPLFIGVYSTAA